ncbi:MAG: aminotransferase class V-fold PLP-dependent enzyme, partial [Rhizobiales bacterium]|nr:aminotransferase class V-fold PLP-dependent enzyme [Hyphomicrobiales bacterium]
VHLDVDVRDLGVDFYAMTGHKLYGPSGIGVLYGRKELLAGMPPYQGGGEMISEVFTDRITYGDPPQRFEAGTPPIVQTVGLAAALDYIESVGRPAIMAHEADLASYARERLAELNSIRVLGDAPGRGAIFSFEMEGAHAHDVSTIIDRSGIAVRAGTHCAEPLLARFGANSTCRASFGMYNTRAEVDALVEALVACRRFFE